MIGDGKNIWPDVEVHEREFIVCSPADQIFLTPCAEAELYQVVFDAALSDPNSTPHGREGFYFGESDEHSLYDLAKAYSRVLYDLGKGKSPDPTTFTDEEAQKYYRVILFLLFLTI